MCLLFMATFDIGAILIPKGLRRHHSERTDRDSDPPTRLVHPIKVLPHPTKVLPKLIKEADQLTPKIKREKLYYVEAVVHSDISYKTVLTAMRKAAVGMF